MQLLAARRLFSLAPLALFAGACGHNAPAPKAATGPRFAVCFVDAAVTKAACTSKPELTEADIARAVSTGNVVAIDLSQDAAARFGAATKVNAGRRMVILIDGKVQGTPIVNADIDVHHFELTVATADDAKPLSQALTPSARSAP